ncbi:MAG TPA: biopolymer transporter ExbD [Cyclobacteriaceae bacterium]
MSKFKKKAVVKQEIPTSSMPDVVFILLFFFMVTTEIREVTVEVQQRIPEASQMRKLARKSLVTNLFVGEPRKTEQFGKEAKIQANDVFIEPKDIVLWVSKEKDKLAENERDQLTVALKVDNEAKRGIIADVETELRKANSRKVLYTTVSKKEENL